MSGGVFSSRGEPLEIERKFLIRRPAEQTLLALGAQRLELRQIYLCSEPGGSRRVRRVREADGAERWYYTEKRRLSPQTNIERERELDDAERELLLRDADSTRRPVEKTRWRLPWQGRTLEIDVFPFWRRQAYCEVELEAEDAPLTLPSWIEVLREVTGEAAYSNKALARAVPPEDGEGTTMEGTKYHA